MITVVKNTNKFQNGDYSKHKNFNSSIHKVYNNIKEWKQSKEYFNSNNITTFSQSEINALKRNNSYFNDDNNWK